VLQLERESTHSQPAGGPGTGSVSEARARQSINTLTNCQGIRDGFGKRGSTSTEHQDTYSLSRDKGRVRSAKLELDRASTHSPTVKGSGTRSVSEARAQQSIQHTHSLSRDPGRVRLVMFKLDRASTHSLSVKGSGTGSSARLELDRTSTHSQSVKGSGTTSVSEARAQQSINTLTSCEGIRNGFSQRGSSSTEHQHTHSLSRDQ
jgi:hypothetical protein